MPIPNAPRLSVSTFSLHRALGVNYRDAPGLNGDRIRTEPYGPGEMSLLELPDRIAAAGIHTLEISHPHLPDRDPGYLNELRSAIDAAGVTLLSVLVEDGDITHPEHAQRDLEWMGGWIETAGLLGAERARVIAGKSKPTEETLKLSRRGLQQLASKGRDCGVRVTVENWFDLLSSPPPLLELLDSLDDQIGFNLDFGNWDGPTKYDDLAAIFHLAESCHAKCHFDSPFVPDDADYRHCLELAREADFKGPYTLIYSGPDNDEWRGLEIETDLVTPYLAASER